MVTKAHQPFSVPTLLSISAGQWSNPLISKTSSCLLGFLLSLWTPSHYCTVLSGSLHGALSYSAPSIHFNLNSPSMLQFLHKLFSDFLLGHTMLYLACFFLKKIKKRYYWNCFVLKLWNKSQNSRCPFSSYNIESSALNILTSKSCLTNSHGKYILILLVIAIICSSRMTHGHSQNRISDHINKWHFTLSVTY